MAERLKDMFFTDASIRAVAEAVQQAYPRFDPEKFVQLVFDDAFCGLENSFTPGDHAFQRKHSFADLSTRKHYPGEHQIAIVVNGREKSKVSLRLLKQ